MKIFYLNMDEIALPEDFLQNFVPNRKFLSETKKKEHLYGRFLVEKIGKEIFKIDNTELELVNKKPRFKNSQIHFSISHSKNIVLTAFDKNPVGADIEYMKNRDFKSLMERYNYKSADKETFYRFWTEYEAGIKLQGTPLSKFSTKLTDEYMLTVAGNFSDNIEIYKLTDYGFQLI